jgi:rod shape-determining protein MreC
MGSKPWKTVFPAIILLISLAFVLIAFWSPKGRGNTAGALSLEAAGPAAALTSGISSFIEKVWRDYFDLVGTRSENKKLLAVVSRQNKLISELSEERQENRRLRRLLNYRARTGQRYVTARILAWDPGPFHQAIVIGAGEEDGLYPDSAVITLDGVVGRVAELSPHYAKVLLVTDLSSGVDAFVARNRVSALMVGGGAGKLSLDYVRKAEDVRLGDLVISSGLDGIFPPGIPLGTVTFVDKMSMGFFMRAEASPQVDMTTLEEVLVVLDPPVPLDWLELAPDVKAIYEKKNQRK